MVVGGAVVPVAVGVWVGVAVGGTGVLVAVGVPVTATTTGVVVVGKTVGVLVAEVSGVVVIVGDTVAVGEMTVALCVGVGVGNSPFVPKKAARAKRSTPTMAATRMGKGRLSTFFSRFGGITTLFLSWAKVSSFSFTRWSSGDSSRTRW